jgi:zinc protease
VIISELQGGENDPDQLLDQELTATAMKAHPYRHPTIGWMPDLLSMTRDDLFEYYRRYYVPNNASLVIVGDVEFDDALRRAARHFGPIPAGAVTARQRTVEPEQTGERRLVIRKEGTAAYLKIGYHAPAVGDPAFFPVLVLDAVLTGAKGMNLWSSFRTPAPQRSARLYRALVERGLASTIVGALLPTQDPFLYTISAVSTEGTPLSTLEDALLAELERVRNEGITPRELARAKAQLKARFVFDDDSISSMAHQIGYFETIGAGEVLPALAARVEAVTLDQAAASASQLLRRSNRTVGWFDPKGSAA